MRLGKDLRQGEEAPMARRLEALGVPLHYTLHGPARAEGGDLLWVDHDTLAVGLGFRTNAEGLRQLKEALAGPGVAVMPVELPYYAGPEACLHLLSLISIVDHKLAVIYPPLMSVPFWQYLRARGFRFVEVPPEEFETMGTNVLALAPGQRAGGSGQPDDPSHTEGVVNELATVHAIVGFAHERVLPAGWSSLRERWRVLSWVARGSEHSLSLPQSRHSTRCRHRPGLSSKSAESAESPTRAPPLTTC